MKQPYFLTVITLIVFGLTGLFHPLYASNEVYATPWDGTISEITPSGSTYTVKTAEELAWVAQQNDALDGFKGKTIKLAANIDLNGSNRKRIWTPIGTQDHPFLGTFNGQNHLIRGLGSIDTDDGVGVFGFVGRDGLTKGKIQDVGISGGCLIAVRQRRVGTLVGVCAGDVERCWSMAEIAMSGNVTGGLIGELQASGTLTDAYCNGLIRNAGDTIGVLVGLNAGSIKRAYTTGYAKNGCSFVGASEVGAKYEKCYFDRKLYYQEPGVVNKGLTPVNDTNEMFSCMKGLSNWSITAGQLYPQLKNFVGTDASRLSVAPVLVDTKETDPINHANDLTVDFKVDIKDGEISWKTQEEAGKDWIQFTPADSKVTVIRPCTETDVLATASLGDEQKTVYFRPRRVDDLKEGAFEGKNSLHIICWKDDILISDSIKSDKELKAEGKSFLARNGWGEHHYMVVRYGYNSSDEMIPLDTLEADMVGDNKYTLWSDTAKLITDTAGNFILRSYVHDDRCVPEWTQNEGEFKYTVLPELIPGVIPERLDTFYLNGNGSVNLTLADIAPATGGTGKFQYSWRNSEKGGDIIPPGDNRNLTYTLSRAVKELPFYRIAKDDSGCDGKLSEGVYKVTTFDSLRLGAINERNTTGMNKRVFCSMEEALAYTITATAATGGSGKYLYQWFLQSGATLTPISGATNRDLPLVDITFVIGKEYTFVRKAQDDTRFTDWALSNYKQTIQVVAELIPGVIPTRQDTFYLDSKGEVNITLTAISPASAGSGHYGYAWRNSPTGKNIIDFKADGNLSYTLTTPVKDLAFYRYVTDSTECGGKLSEGIYKVTVFAALTSGAVNDESSAALGKLVFCSVADAQAHTITTSSPAGGSGKYEYQWYIQSGSSLSKINGATSASLKLSSVTMTAGNDYTFVRQVKDDTRFSKWTQSVGKQTIHIKAKLDAGAIEDGDRGRQCLDPSTPWLTVTVNETKAASGEGKIEYRWLRINGSSQTEIGNEKNLSEWTFVDETNSYIKYTYVREVRQDNCEWVRSSGQITESYGIKTVGEETRTVCVSQLPYTMTWKDSGGKEFTHTFTKGGSGDTWTVTDDNNPSGCPAEITITLHVVQRPLISSMSEAKFCQNESNITISFEEKDGDAADIFFILYSDALAKYIGRKDTTGSILTPGTIVLRNVPPLPDVTGQYLDLQVGASGGTLKPEDIECKSEIQRVNLVSHLGGYVHSKFSRVLFVDNNPNNGEVPDPKLHFKAYQWYKNGHQMEGQTGQYYQEDGKLLNGVYHVQLTDDKGNTYRSCDIVMPEEESQSTTVPPAVYPVPVGAGEPLKISCYGGKAEICTCTGESILTTECPDETVTVSAPRVTGIYYVRITRNDGTTLTEKLIVK